jgi:hypothetical protein
MRQATNVLNGPSPAPDVRIGSCTSTTSCMLEPEALHGARAHLGLRVGGRRPPPSSPSDASSRRAATRSPASRTRSSSARCAAPGWFAPPPGDWPEPTELLGFTFQDSDRGLPDDDSEPLADDLEAFIAGDASEEAPSASAPIVVSMGTATMHSGSVYQAVVEAGGRLGRRVLVLTHFADDLPNPLPSHVLHVPYAPFSRVLPRAAERVARLGCGVSVPQKLVGVPRITSALEELLASTDVAQACADASGRFRNDPHGRHVVRRFGDLVESMLAAA